jgi:NAD(P)-dependent dehydrogenase (short-subunit alcohol dehydrogenase family)
VAHSIHNRVVAITGAARGIGRATAEAMLAAGARVAIGDLDVDLAHETAASLGGDCRAYALDVTDRASFAAFLDAAEADLGAVDVLVNNAGIMFVGDFLTMDDATVDLQLDVNLRGVLTGMRLAGIRMRERRDGHIVNVASVAGLVGAPGGTTYSATKHAVVGATASLRAELRSHGVHVSVVCPTVVRTELGGGLGDLKVPPVDPEHVAAAIVRVVRTRRNIVTVPAWMAGLGQAISWLPSKAQETITRTLGSDRALAEADAARRAEYEQRARRSAPDDSPHEDRVAERS